MEELIKALGLISLSLSLSFPLLPALQGKHRKRLLPSVKRDNARGEVLLQGALTNLSGSERLEAPSSLAPDAAFKPPTAGSAAPARGKKNTVSSKKRDDKKKEWEEKVALRGENENGGRDREMNPRA